MDIGEGSAAKSVSNPPLCTQMRENEHNKLQARHESYMREASMELPGSPARGPALAETREPGVADSVGRASAVTPSKETCVLDGVVRASAVTPSRALSTPSKRRPLIRLY